MNRFWDLVNLSVYNDETVKKHELLLSLVDDVEYCGDVQLVSQIRSFLDLSPKDFETVIEELTNFTTMDADPDDDGEFNNYTYIMWINRSLGYCIDIRALPAHHTMARRGLL